MGNFVWMKWYLLKPRLTKCGYMDDSYVFFLFGCNFSFLLFYLLSSEISGVGHKSIYKWSIFLLILRNLITTSRVRMTSRSYLFFLRTFSFDFEANYLSWMATVFGSQNYIYSPWSGTAYHLLENLEFRSAILFIFLLGASNCIFSFD